MNHVPAAETFTGEKNPNDYYYRPGMTLRAPPSRAVPSREWFEMRKRLFSDWIDVQEVPRQTLLTRKLDDHLWQGDETVDALVALTREIGAAKLRQMVETAIARGVEAVEAPPQALVDFFQEMERIPDWFDAQMYERGRLRMIDCTPIGKTGGILVNTIMTAFGAAVGAAVGASGRFKYTPYRRQLETLAFFQKVPLPDGLSRFSDTFATTARVRIMHAQVRAALRRKWGPAHYAEHGDPISATDMALGVPAYGVVNLLIDASFGRKISAADLDDVNMYWAYTAFRFGVSEYILPRNGMEAIQQFDYTLATYGKASRWGDEVAEALLDFVHESMTDTGSAATDRLNRWIGFPLMLGFFVNIGRDPVGYRAVQSRCGNRLLLNVLERAFTASARRTMRKANRADKRPGREERMRQQGMAGDPFLNDAMKVTTRLAVKNGVPRATFDSHDQSKPVDFAAP